MAPPTAYTEAELKTYLVAVLSEVATVLGWTTATTQLAEAVNDTLLAYDTSDISTVSGATNIAKLRALGAVMAWRAAVNALGARYDFAEADADQKRSQLHAQAKANLALAESYAAEWGVGALVAHVQTIQHVDDPYAWIPEDRQTVPL
jgi:hypothetical protein